MVLGYHQYVKIWTYTTHQNQLKIDHNLNAKPKTAKYLQENIWRKICDLGLDKGFLDMKLRSMIPKRENVNKLDLSKVMSVLQNTEKVKATL